MKEFNSIEEILDFAINEEQQAVEFYTSLAEKRINDDMRSVFVEFAEEELMHKARLTEIKSHGIVEFNQERIADLKIADYLVN